MRSELGLVYFFSYTLDPVALDFGSLLFDIPSSVVLFFNPEVLRKPAVVLGPFTFMFFVEIFD